jgi:hypothetical protein
MKTNRLKELKQMKTPGMPRKLLETMVNNLNQKLSESNYNKYNDFG